MHNLEGTFEEFAELLLNDTGKLIDLFRLIS